MMSPVLPYFPIKRITTKKPEYTKNMWQKRDIPDEVGQLVQSMKQNIVFCSKHILATTKKNMTDFIIWSVLNTSPVVPTWLLSNKRQPTRTSADHLKTTCINIYTMAIHGNPWPQGLRATVSQNSLYLDSQESRSLWGHHVSNWSPKSNYEQRQIDTDHLVWLTPQKKHSAACLRKIFESTLMYLAKDCWLLSYTHTAIK